MTERHFVTVQANRCHGHGRVQAEPKFIERSLRRAQIENHVDFELVLRVNVDGPRQPFDVETWRIEGGFVGVRPSDTLRPFGFDEPNQTADTGGTED